MLKKKKKNHCEPYTTIKIICVSILKNENKMIIPVHWHVLEVGKKGIRSATLRQDASRCTYYDQHVQQ